MSEDPPKKQSSLARAMSNSNSGGGDGRGQEGGSGRGRGRETGRGGGRGDHYRGGGRGGRGNYHDDRGGRGRDSGRGRGGRGRYDNSYNDNRQLSINDRWNNINDSYNNNQRSNYNDRDNSYNDRGSYNTNNPPRENYRGSGENYSNYNNSNRGNFDNFHRRDNGGYNNDSYDSRGRGGGRGGYSSQGGHSNNSYDNRGRGGGRGGYDSYDNRGRGGYSDSYDNRGRGGGGGGYNDRGGGYGNNYNDRYDNNRDRGYNNSTYGGGYNDNRNNDWRGGNNYNDNRGGNNWNDHGGRHGGGGGGYRGGGRGGGGRYDRGGGRGGGGRGRGRGRDQQPQYHNSYNTHQEPPPNKPQLPGEYRGIFGPKGDSEEWIKAMSEFPNGVPRFESKEDCLKFMTDYTDLHGGSNPDYPHLKHIFTTLITWDQIETVLIPAMEQARNEPSEAVRVTEEYGLEPNDDSENIYEQTTAQSVVDAINARLDQPFHIQQTEESVMNTLKYAFFHMKRGIYVMIHNGELRIFCPFSNMHYTNSWSHALRLEGNRGPLDYYDFKARFWRKEVIETDVTKWWANGNIICNTPCEGEDLHPSQLQQWGDHFLCPLRDSIAQACRERKIPDCEFFLNKRDYPQIKVNVERGIPVEPYGFIFDNDDRDPDQDVDLVEEHCYKTMAPMVSFYAASETRFTDLPWPSSEDWEGACGQVFPQTFISFEWDAQGRPEFRDPRDLFTESNFCKFQRGWNEDRVATAFFRGSATGGGTAIDSNQRLKLTHLSNLWRRDPEKGGPEPFLDAAITGWNSRDKKTASSPVTFVRRQDFQFKGGRQNYTPIYEQSRYKYLVYVDGHCAACRYGFMMRLGCVILKVESQIVADRMWYFPLLQPWVDHVPVKADMSDLEEKIRWCRANDDKCQEIAANSVHFYEKYVAQKPLLDYIEMVTKHIAKRQLQIGPSTTTD